MTSFTCSLAVIILTHNESLHIERSIRSVLPFASQVFVIDSFSTDGTIEIARELGAIVLQNPWVNYAHQFTWALDNAPIDAAWIMRLDADEVIEPDLAQEISAELPRLANDVAGINLDRRHIFMGRWIKHGRAVPVAAAADMARRAGTHRRPLDG